MDQLQHPSFMELRFYKANAVLTKEQRQIVDLHLKECSDCRDGVQLLSQEAPELLILEELRSEVFDQLPSSLTKRRRSAILRNFKTAEERLHRLID